MVRRCGTKAAGLWLCLAVVGVMCGCRRQPSEGTTPTPVALPNRTVRVLCYHDLQEKAGNLYETSVADFRTQLQALRDQGFQTITNRELADYLGGVKDIPERPVLITFDDGNKSVLTAAKPVLDEFGFRANLFLITDSVGGKGNLTWDDAKQLAAAGWDVGSHTAGHSNLTKRGKQESAQQHPERIRREIATSYARLEEKIGTPPAALAYPFGNYDATCIKACQEAGYRLAYSIDPGAVDQQSDPWRLPRKMIVNGTSQRTFARLLATEPLHLNDTTPPVGQRVAGRTYSLSARVGDPDALASLGVECGATRAAQVKLDPQTSMLSVTCKLNRGANLVRVFSTGTPRRETGWIVVCDP
jgi:peptidoglycan/xylan/chitin deacetylase (PgdA/CDA1 family)